MNVADLMKTRVLTCNETDSLEAVARTMWENDVGALPVIDEAGRPIAMVTDRDICMAAYTKGAALRDIAVTSAMSQTLRTAAPDMSLGDVEDLMKRAQIRRVPVVSPTGQLLGIITLGDLAHGADALKLPFVAPAITRTLAAITEHRV